MKAYLFDFDGTLVDSMSTYANSLYKILDDNNVSYGDDLIKIITPLGLSGTAEYCISIGLDLTKEEIISLMGKYMYEEYVNNIPAKNNVISVLKELKSRGIKLNVLTASPHITLDACLKRLGIFDIFDNVWSCDDFGTTKTDPVIYIKAAEKIGENVEDIIFFDDNLFADLTAKSVGMKVCGVYDDSSKEYIDDMKKQTDYYINDFSELLELNI